MCDLRKQDKILKTPYEEIGKTGQLPEKRDDIAG